MTTIDNKGLPNILYDTREAFYERAREALYVYLYCDLGPGVKKKHQMNIDSIFPNSPTISLLSESSLTFRMKINEKEI